MTYKAIFCAVVGIVGGFIAQLFGAWTIPLTILAVCMGLDYASGIVLAFVFHASPKSSEGGLDSAVGWKGLARKVATLVVVLVAHFVDLLLGTVYLRDAVVIAFVINEIVSILENCGLMGVPIPNIILQGINVLRQRTQPPDAASAGEEGERHD